MATDGTSLSLRGLLHYLWNQAELTRRQPGFAGKRSRATVRKHLLPAAENKIARGGALHARLYSLSISAHGMMPIAGHRGLAGLRSSGLAARAVA